MALNTTSSETLTPYDTKERLVESAGRLFADLGYTAVSIREIAAEAGVHFSLVNYHFGSKRDLYRAALESAASCGEAMEQLKLESEDLEPKEILLRVARHIVSCYSNNAVPDWHIKLLSHELQSENPDWDALSPHWGVGCDMLQNVFAQLAGRSEPTPLDRLSAISFFTLVDEMGANARHFVSGNPVWNLPDIDSDTVANHVVNLFIHGASGIPQQA